MLIGRLHNKVASCRTTIVTIVIVTLIGASLGGCRTSSLTFARSDRPVMLGKIHNIKGETLIAPYVLKRDITIETFEILGPDRVAIARRNKPDSELMILVDSQTDKVVIDKLYFGLFMNWAIFLGPPGFEGSTHYWLGINGGIYAKGKEPQEPK